ncbi:MAG: hypothetical protein LBD43_01195 [Holosporales bacterium]|jgi:hypothetical protein|nr:hypothetical protein [Holosporales bacterium]
MSGKLEIQLALWMIWEYWVLKKVEIQLALWMIEIQLALWMIGALFGKDGVVKHKMLHVYLL